MWISVAIASIFAWTLQMASIYFAMTYRSYLPRFRRQTAISEAVSKKKQEESTMAPNMAQLQLEPVPEKELQPLPKEESQPVPTKNLQPVSRGEPQKPLPAKDQQLVPSPSTNEKAKVQVEEKH